MSAWDRGTRKKSPIKSFLLQLGATSAVFKFIRGGYTGYKSASIKSHFRSWIAITFMR